LAGDPTMVRADQLGSASNRTAGDGVHGDPSRSSAELGELGLDLIVRTSVDAIQAAVAAH
jgi:creatinine amidohydrolase